MIKEYAYCHKIRFVAYPNSIREAQKEILDKLKDLLGDEDEKQ